MFHHGQVTESTASTTTVTTYTPLQYSFVSTDEYPTTAPPTDPSEIAVFAPVVAAVDSDFVFTV